MQKMAAAQLKPDGVSIERIDDALAKLLAISPELVVGHLFLELIWPEDRIAAAVSIEKEKAFDTQLRHISGMKGIPVRIKRTGLDVSISKVKAEKEKKEKEENAPEDIGSPSERESASQD
jgi:hypothetical protein